MKRLYFVLPFLVFGVLWLRPVPALAGLHFCNKTEHRLFVAVGMAYGNCSAQSCTLRSEGWWNVEPGGCKTPIGAALDGSGATDYYYYAEDGNGATWTGPVTFCIDDEDKFDFGDSEQTDCAGTHKSFRHIETAGATDYTVSLTP